MEQDEGGHDLTLIENMLCDVIIEVRQRFLFSLSDGDYFGEQALFRYVPNIASVRTAEDTHLAVIYEQEFE